MRTYNIKEAYLYQDDPCSGILAAAAFAILSTSNMLKGFSPGQLVFGHEMFPLVKHTVYWELIGQKTQMHISKYNIHKNSKILDHN